MQYTMLLALCYRFYSSLRSSCAETVRRKMFDWIAAQRPGVFVGLQTPTSNVFIADFVDLNDNEFCKLIIGLNTKLFSEFVDVELNEDESMQSMIQPE